MDGTELDTRFTHHVPNETRLPIHTEVRRLFREFAQQLAALPLPDCRETSLMWTQLEQASFWGHAAIARRVP